MASSQRIDFAPLLSRPIGLDCALIISVTVPIREYPSVRVYPIGSVSAPQRLHLTTDSATRSSPP
jgi:hypothetical protein